MDTVQLGPKLFASPCGTIPSATDTCTLVYSKPFIASPSLASAWIPSNVSLSNVALATPHPLMV
eukprot:12832786-Prorocentrum_lima.AAC.1